MSEKCGNKSCWMYAYGECSIDASKECDHFTTTPTQSITAERLTEYKTQEHNLNMLNECYKEDQSTIQRLTDEVERFVEYVEFLNKANEGPISTAQIHGWKCPERDIQKGKELRSAIDHLNSKG